MPSATPVISLRVLSPFQVLSRCLVHILLLAVIVFSLVALWQNSEQAGFAVLLLWTLVAYIILFTLAWHGDPSTSLTATIFRNYRKATPLNPPPVTSENSQSNQFPFPSSDNHNPYLYHEPPYRVASTSFDYPQTLPSHSRAVDSDPDDEDDEDDEEKQRRMEQEMQRRDVSIITVPRRPLRIANL